MMGGDPADARGRNMPPLLVEQKGLVDQIERELLPSLSGKPAVLWQRLDAPRRLIVGESATACIRKQPHRLSCSFLGELNAPAGRRGKMRSEEPTSELPSHLNPVFRPLL